MICRRQFGFSNSVTQSSRVEKRICTLPACDEDGALAASARSSKPTVSISDKEEPSGTGAANTEVAKRKRMVDSLKSMVKEREGVDERKV